VQDIGGELPCLRELGVEPGQFAEADPFGERVSGSDSTSRRSSPTEDLIDLVRRVGRAGDVSARELVAEFHALGKIQSHLVHRITAAMLSNQLPPTAGSLIRLFSGESATRRAEIALELAGRQR
jgi:hypothetical protein